MQFVSCERSLVTLAAWIERPVKKEKSTEDRVTTECCCTETKWAACYLSESTPHRLFHLSLSFSPVDQMFRSFDHVLIDTLELKGLKNKLWLDSVLYLKLLPKIRQHFVMKSTPLWWTAIRDPIILPPPESKLSSQLVLLLQLLWLFRLSRWDHLLHRKCGSQSLSRSDHLWQEPQWCSGNYCMGVGEVLRKLILSMSGIQS